MKTPIIELTINESALAGWDALALVEKPAIEQEFMAFAKEKFAETFNDYPEAAVEAAKQGIKRNEESGNKCGTAVGKQRAQQLANREKISLDTIQRMRSFLLRQKDNYDLAVSRKEYDACGYISYLLWGGEAALPWAEKKLRQAGYEFDLDEACWPGYEAIGTKIKDGREVPNCVRKEKFNKDYVFLISCSAEKKDYKCAAAELYDSPLFKKSLEFSRKKATGDDRIKIISAKLYLVDLDQVIEPYDLTLKNMSSDEQKAWAEKTYEMIKAKFNVDKDKFVFLAGSAYTKYLLPKFKYKSDFLEGKRLGERMQYLDTFSEAQHFIIATNDRDHAVKHNFTLVDVERDLVDEILMTELSELIAEFNAEEQEMPTDVTVLNNTLKSNKFAQEMAEKQMFIAPVMRANYLIPRMDEDGLEYQVFFSPETIKKIAYKAMKDGKIHKMNIEHDPKQPVDDVYMVETWLVEDPEQDKSTLYGYTPNKGDWYSMFKVDNSEIWNDYIKTGEVKGVSVEGYFIENFSKLK